MDHQLNYRLKPGQYHYVKEDGDLILKGEGEVVRLTPRQFRAFKDKFVPADEEADILPKTQEKRRRLRMDHHGGGRYNVVNLDDDEKPLNSDWLTREEALDLMEAG